MPTLPSGKPMPGPEECEPTELRLDRVLAERSDIPPKLRQYAERTAEERRQSSIEVRNTDAKDLGWMGASRGKNNPE
jgi:acyl-CoA thioesterase 8